MATVKISKLPVYVVSQIKDTDLLPIAASQEDGVTFITQKATALQIANYILQRVTTQAGASFSPEGASFLNLNTGNFVADYITALGVSAIDISATNLHGDYITALGVSAVNISATTLYGDGSNLTGITLADQTLNTTSNVTFNTINVSDLINTNSLISLSADFTSLTSASANFANLTANNIHIGNLSVGAKYVDFITHTGSPHAHLYSINHPYNSVQLIAQLYEVNLTGPITTATAVIVDMIHHQNYTNIELLNVSNAKYMLVFTG